MRVGIKAVTFDFWSTLFVEQDETVAEQHSISAMIQILSSHGIGVAEELVKQLFLEARAVCFDRQENHGLDFSPEEQMAFILQGLGIGEDPVLTRELLIPYTTTLYRFPPVLIPGAADVLRELAEDYSLALICNTGRTPGSVIREILKENNLIHYFKVLQFSNELAIAKPNPEIFRKTLNLLGAEPNQAVHIGDNPLTDVLGGHRVGMKTVWFNWRGINATNIPYDVLITDLRNLTSAVASINENCEKEGR